MSSQKETDQKLKNIVRFAQLTLSMSDSGLDTISQVTSTGKPINALMIYPYGISARAPKNSSVLLFSTGGSSQNPAGIPYFTENRFRDLKEWEVKVGNFKTKACVFFNEDGNVRIETKSGASQGFIEIDVSTGQANINDNFTVDV